MTVDIRRLGPADLERLGRAAPDVFDRPFHPERARAFLEDPRHHLIVALDDDVIVGMVTAVDYRNPDKPPELWINEVGVASSHRRRGIGRRLLRAMLAHGQQLGCVQAWLATEEDNVAARALYEGLGGSGARQILYTFGPGHADHAVPAERAD